MADYATLVFDIDSTQARGAAKSLADLNSAVIKAANGSSKFEKTLRDTNGRFQSTAKYIAQNRAEVESLAMAYNHVLAAQIKYRDEAIRTAAAVKAGVITEQQRIDILQRTKTALDAAASANGRLDKALNTSSVAVKKFGESQKVASHHAANLSFQINDIGMMMASGQSPFMLMIQQGPQVAQILSQMTAEGRKIGPTLASSFRMILNPTTLLTLALIGGTAALVQWATGSSKASDEAKKSSDSLERLRNAYSNLASVQARQSATLEKQIEQYGRYWVTISQVTEQLGINAKEAARQEANAAISALGFDPRAMQGYENQIRSIMEARNDLSEESRRNAIEALGIEKESLELYGLQYDQVQRLVEIQNQLKSNDLGLDERNRLSAEFNEILTKGVNNGAKLKVEMIAAGDSVLKLADEMSRNAANTERAERAMRGFGSAASTASLSHLVSQAAQLANNLRAASSIANAIGGRAETFAGGVFDVVKNAYQSALDKIDEIDANSLGQRPKSRPFSVSETAIWGPEEKGGGGGGSAAKAAQSRAEAEVRAAEKGFQSLRELLQKETLFQFAEYEKRQAQLDSALNKQLITRQEYEEYNRQLRVNYFGTEYQQQQLRYDLEHQQLKDALEKQKITREEYAAFERQNQWRQVAELGKIRDTGVAYDLQQLSEGFSQAAALAGDYNDKFLRAQKIFAASAALISTYQGAAKALELPFPMNIAAAAKVLAAGLGFVSAIKGGGSGGKSTSGSSDQSVKQEPTKNVLIRLEGDEWLTGLAEQMMTQIYEASSNGRVIIARDNS